MKKIYMVGLGPGSLDQMTGQALAALEESQVIVGYTVYVDLIRERFSHKEFFSTPMRQEVERCRLAADEALTGKTVAMVCSGDAGVYGMAGLMYQVTEGQDIDIEIVPGITAACSGGAVLGAPLIHDFAVISLSDLLTPWELIEKRLTGAAMADFVICLYNPSSKKRSHYLSKACDIILRYQGKETVCGVVSQIGREGQQDQIMTLEALRDYQADMFTTVFIGNSMTQNIGGKMVTPRGYKQVEQVEQVKP